jgi:DNA-binding beta-propeller fold protein YncE
MRRLAALAAASLAAACAHGEVRRVGAHLPGDPAWPRGGERRITWVGEIRGPENLGIERGLLGRIWDFISGREALEGLYRPYGVALDATGRLAVADPGRRTVHLYDPVAGRALRLTGEDGAPLVYPVAVAFLGRTLLVADAEAGALRAFDDQGRPAPFPVALPALARPTGLAVDEARGRLFVVDAAAHVVHVLPTVAGGTPRVLGGRGDGPGRFNTPTHVAVDGRGQLAVCDALNFRVQLFDADLNLTGTFGQNGDGLGDLARPKGLVIDGEGVVFVVEGYFDVIQAFQPDGTLLGVMGGSGIAPGRFWLAGGLALDARGRLYVADTFNARVQVFDLAARAP